MSSLRKCHFQNWTLNLKIDYEQEFWQHNPLRCTLTATAAGAVLIQTTAADEQGAGEGEVGVSRDTGKGGDEDMVKGTEKESRVNKKNGRQYKSKKVKERMRQRNRTDGRRGLVVVDRDGDRVKREAEKANKTSIGPNECGVFYSAVVCW